MPKMPKKGQQQDLDEEEFSFGDLNMSSWADPSHAPEAEKTVNRGAAIMSVFAKPKTSNENFTVDKAIQLDPVLAAAAAGTAVLTAEQVAAANRMVDNVQYPGAENFHKTTVFLAIDGHQPDARTTSAANALRALMGASAGTTQAVDRLQQAALVVASTLAKLGEHYATAGGAGSAQVNVALGAVPREAMGGLQRGLAAVQPRAAAAAQAVEGLQKSAAKRQDK